MLYIYASTSPLGTNPQLNLVEDNNSIPHLPVGVDVNSAVKAINLTESKRVYFYLIKVTDQVDSKISIKSDSLEMDYKVEGAKVNKVFWLTNLDEVTTSFLSIVDVSPTEDGFSFKEQDASLINKVEEMDWLDYYCLALRENMFTKRKWLLDVFSIKRNYTPKGKWEIGKDEEKQTYFTLSPEGARIDITGVPTNKAVVTLFRRVTAYKGDLVNIKETVETTTGELLVNALAFCYKYGDYQTYKKGKIKPNDFHAFFASLLKDNKLEDVGTMRKAIDAIEQLSALAEIAVPAASRASLTMHPDNRKLIDGELAKLTDKNNQVKLAEIDAKGVALDKEHIKGSPSEPFFIKGKMHSIIRKKTGMMYGSETDLDGSKTETATKSLEQGWDIDSMPSYINAVRAGANLRGLKTAEGGSDMKETSRMLSAYRVDVEDCRSKEGLKIVFKKNTIENYIGRYLLGSDKPLTKEDLTSLIGKESILRDVGYCKAEGYSLCVHCCGEPLRSFKNGIALEAANLGSVFQANSMAATHGKALETTYFDLEIYCS